MCCRKDCRKVMNAAWLKKSLSWLLESPVSSLIRAKARHAFQWYCEKSTCPASIEDTGISPLEDTVSYNNERLVICKV